MSELDDVTTAGASTVVVVTGMAGVGKTLLAAGEHDQAKTLFEQARDAAADAGLSQENASATRGLAEVALASGDLTSARAYVEEALVLAGPERRLLTAECDVTVAKIDLAAGSVGDALAAASRALTAARDIGHVLCEAEALKVLAAATVVS